MRQRSSSTGGVWPALRAVLVMAGLALALQGCGGGGGGDSSGGGGGGGSTPTSSTGGTSPIVTSGNNVVPVVVEQGPNPNAPNVPFVSVTVCVPSSSVCDTVDHVMVDTGSTGLRLLAGSLPTSLANLGVNKDRASQSAIDECGLFVSGYTWGSTRVADVTIGQESAPNQIVQVIADPSAGSVPTDCASAGSNTAISTASALGANGVLGLQGFLQDCGSACANTTNPVPAAYYTCGSSTCQAVGVPLIQQVGNTVASFATDNNGAILQLPSVGASGAPSVNGSLVFGIGTQANNALQQAVQIPTDASFSFTATYKGSVIGNSFVDSGSNFLFFSDSALPLCTQSGLSGFYCPTSTQQETATLASSSASSTLTYPASFSIANAATVLANTGNYAFSNIGANVGSGQGLGMDFGLPFFFGKNVYIGFAGVTTSNGSSTTSSAGYVAFSSNGT